MRTAKSIVLIALLCLQGCTSNSPSRTVVAQQCVSPNVRCAESILEQHREYDLGFLEFSERGNLFNRDHLDTVLQHVRRTAQRPQGATIVVFVHGWKHNARDTDENVRDFRSALQILADRNVAGSRRIVGVYVAWRGQSIDLPVLQELTYWDRKSVAEEVGKGGVTEVLLHLRKAARVDRHMDRNQYLIIGHSFGGAIVLSALNEILLDRLISAPESDDCRPATDRTRKRRCINPIPFAHGVVLLNPAIEANVALQLKEIAAEHDYPDGQAKLLHVISTDGDTATRRLFPIGQWLDLRLTWKQTDLKRTYAGKTLTVREKDVDVTTIGNYEPFLTDRLEWSRDGSAQWQFHSCVANPAQCRLSEENYFPASANDPLKFVSTDETFSRDHNDIFNCHVAAYLSTVVVDARHAFGDPTSVCRFDGTFSFPACFTYFHERLSSSRGNSTGEGNGSLGREFCLTDQ